MCSHLLRETVLSRQEAARRLKVGVLAVRRWIEHGTEDGVKLEGFKAGRQWRTTAEALDRFVEAQTAKALGLPGPKQRTKRQAQRADEQARRELEAAGWL